MHTPVVVNGRRQREGLRPVIKILLEKALQSLNPLLTGRFAESLGDAQNSSTAIHIGVMVGIYILELEVIDSSEYIGETILVNQAPRPSYYNF